MFIQRGLPFERAFERATGAPLWAAYGKWEKKNSSYYRVIPVVTSTTTMWLLITLLVILAFRRKKLRHKEILERWELEDEEPPSFRPH